MRLSLPHPAHAMRGWVALGVVLLLMLLPADAFAQDTDADIPSVTRTFALENVRIVQAPGRVIEQGTLLVRDGLIAAVGTNVEIPFDAERITGDSLTVYAGFIDGLSNTGLPKPKEEENQPRVDDPGNPPNDRAGIQPERDVRTMIDPGQKSIKDLRAAGFGAAHIVPHGRMLPGTGSVILLSGDAPDAMVIQGEVSLFAQFEGARGMYPATPMAMTAKMRQLYREADRRHRIEAMYADNPSGMERPVYDAVHYAFFPVLEGTQPVFFYVDSALELHRALKLKADLGFPLILGGLNESFNMIDDLQAANVPLFFSLQLPKQPKEMAKLKEDSIDVLIASYDPEFRTGTFRDLEAEKRNLEARQLMTRRMYLENAAKLHEAGLAFGFMTMGVKAGDIHKNLRTMIARGLPEDAALAALTTTPADLLGLSQRLGTIDVGKIANLVVTTAPYFEEDAKIRYVFVDGVKYAYEVKEKKKPSGEGAEDGPINPTGSWTFSVATPGGEIGGNFSLNGSPDDLSGTLSLDMAPGNFELVDIELDGNSLFFAFDFPDAGGRITFDLTLIGEEIEGMATAPGQGDAPVSGSRESGPE